VLIEEIIGALIGHLPILARCPKLIVCDWFKLAKAQGTGGTGGKGGNRYRAGQITRAHEQRYQEYVRRLREMCEPDSGTVLAGAQLLVMESRQGFGYALRAGLAHVHTPYLLVQQHDRRLRQVRGFTCDTPPVTPARPGPRRHDISARERHACLPHASQPTGPCPPPCPRTHGGCAPGIYISGRESLAAPLGSGQSASPPSVASCTHR
jgi:hypothetical protein